MSRYISLITPVAVFIIFLSYGCGGRIKSGELKHHEKETHLNPFDFSDEFAQPAKSEGKIGDDSQPPESKVSGEEQIPPTVSRNYGDDLQRKSTSTPTDLSGKGSDLGYRVQIGAFEKKENADAVKEKVVSKFKLPVYIIYKAPFYRVRLGDFKEKIEAEKYVKLLKDEGFTDARWVPANINTQE
jgi:cell division protein FtsN